MINQAVNSHLFLGWIWETLDNVHLTFARPVQGHTEDSRQLVIRRVQNEGNFFSMTGRLEDLWTGAASHAGRHEHRKKKKRRQAAAADGAERRAWLQRILSSLSALLFIAAPLNLDSHC